MPLLFQQMVSSSEKQHWSPIPIAIQNHQRSTEKQPFPELVRSLKENGPDPESQNAPRKERHFATPWTSASDVPVELWAEQTHDPKRDEHSSVWTDPTRDQVVMRTALMTLSRPFGTRLPAADCPAIEPA